MKLLTKTKCSCFPGRKMGRKTGPPTANGKSKKRIKIRDAVVYPGGWIGLDVLAGNIVFPNFKEEINV